MPFDLSRLTQRVVALIQSSSQEDPQREDLPGNGWPVSPGSTLRTNARVLGLLRRIASVLSRDLGICDAPLCRATPLGGRFVLRL